MKILCWFSSIFFFPVFKKEKKIFFKEKPVLLFIKEYLKRLKRAETTKFDNDIPLYICIYTS